MHTCSQSSNSPEKHQLCHRRGRKSRAALILQNDLFTTVRDESKSPQLPPQQSPPKRSGIPRFEEYPREKPLLCCTLLCVFSQLCTLLCFLSQLCTLLCFLSQVLSAGDLVEQGRPSDLAALPDGVFCKMLHASATATAPLQEQRTVIGKN